MIVHLCRWKRICSARPWLVTAGAGVMVTVRHCSQTAPDEKMSNVCVLLRSEKNQIKIQSLHESCQIQNTVILNNSDVIVCRLRV